METHRLLVSESKELIVDLRLFKSIYLNGVEMEQVNTHKSTNPQISVCERCSTTAKRGQTCHEGTFSLKHL